MQQKAPMFLSFEASRDEFLLQIYNSVHVRSCRKAMNSRLHIDTANEVIPQSTNIHPPIHRHAHNHNSHHLPRQILLKFHHLPRRILLKFHHLPTLVHGHHSALLERLIKRNSDKRTQLQDVLHKRQLPRTATPPPHRAPQSHQRRPVMLCRCIADIRKLRKILIDEIRLPLSPRR